MSSSKTHIPAGLADLVRLSAQATEWHSPPGAFIDEPPGLFTPKQEALLLSAFKRHARLHVGFTPTGRRGGLHGVQRLVMSEHFRPQPKPLFIGIDWADPSGSMVVFNGDRLEAP